MHQRNGLGAAPGYPDSVGGQDRPRNGCTAGGTVRMHVRCVRDAIAVDGTDPPGGVPPLRLKARKPDGDPAIVRRLGQLDVRDERLASIRRDHSVDLYRRIGRVDADDAAGVQQRLEPLEQRNPLLQPVGSSSVARVMSHSIPRAPKSAVAARKSRDNQRWVWCDVGADTWAPSRSGGTSCPVQRWIDWRASASVMSDV